MAFLKDKFIRLSVLLLLLYFVSCNNPEMTKMESVTGIQLSNCLKKQDEVYQWNDFNGNGYKIVTYSIENEKVIDVFNTSKSNGFIAFGVNQDNSALYSNTELLPFIKNSNGIYITEWIENEITTIVIDTTNNKLFYFYSVL